MLAVALLLNQYIPMWKGNSYCVGLLGYDKYGDRGGGEDCAVCIVFCNLPMKSHDFIGLTLSKYFSFPGWIIDMFVP